MHLLWFSALLDWLLPVLVKKKKEKEQEEDEK